MCCSKSSACEQLEAEVTSLQDDLKVKVAALTTTQADLADLQASYDRWDTI